MYLRYDNYTHANNEAGYKISSQAMRSQAGFLYGRRETWEIRGDLLNLPSQEAITQAVNQLRAAYSVDGGDLVFLEDDGQTQTADVLLSANCIGGTHIIQPPNFPNTYGSGEWQAGYGRSYSIVVEGQVALTNANVILEFKETLVQTGTGGPSIVFLPTSENPPVEQNPSLQTVCTYVQSGNAVGLYDYPPFPPPIFPDNEVGEEHKEVQDSPQLYGQFHWPISWSYTFKSATPLNGSPNPYPNL